jgi:23S rRNA (uracil1939-C5)-methyltransferase
MKTGNDSIPVVKNQLITLDITSLGSDGQGIGRYEGFVVFVPFTLPGERAEALIIKVASGYAVGKPMRIIQPSACRLPPRCGVFGRCGGCQLQHMEYPAQLEFKRNTVMEALRKIGGVEAPDVRPVIGMEEPWRYRNKGIFPIGRGAEGVVMGMYAPRSHCIVDVAECPLQPLAVGAAMSAVRRWAQKHDVTTYDEVTGRGLLRNVMVRSFAETGDTMVVLVTNGETLPESECLVAELRACVPGLTGIVQNINAESTNIVLGGKEIVLWGCPSAHARLGLLEYDIGAQSFFQVNTTQTVRLYAAAAEAAALTGNELVIDAYCGVGTIGQFLSGSAGKIIGIESVPASVEEARRSAARNGIGNAEYVCGRAENVFSDLAKKGVKPDVMLMDPPRKGCDARFLDAVAHAGAKKLVYVSCNPATMARDIKHLAGEGFALKSVQPVDMFPQTADVECVALMSHVDS